MTTKKDNYQELRGQPSMDIESPQKSASPPLESGDHLTRQEFERRYNAMPELKKAELIEGVVYMPSPVKFESHAQPHAWIIAWLGVYCASTPDVYLADNATVRLDENNEVQPDGMLMLSHEKGGNSRINDEDYVEGAPELIVEIAHSSASYDLHDKLEIYHRNSVKEYLVWETYNQRFYWFIWQKNKYVIQKPDLSNLLYSKVFPGLVLDVKALLEGNIAKVLQLNKNGVYKRIRERKSSL